MRATEGHVDYNEWPHIVWKCMQEATERHYADPSFEAENDTEEVDDTQLKDATTQNAQLKAENQILLSKLEDMVAKARSETGERQEPTYPTNTEYPRSDSESRTNGRKESTRSKERVPSMGSLSSAATPRFGEEPKEARGCRYFDEIKPTKGKKKAEPVKTIFIGEVSLEVFGGGHLEVVPGRKSMHGNNTVTMCTYFVIKSENEANEILAETIHYVHT